MTIHEATMDRFSQWWRRQIRGGHARAHQVTLHARLPMRHAARESWNMWFWAVREFLSVWFWGILLPTATLVAAWPTAGASLLLLAGYPALFCSIYRRMRRRGFGAADASLYATACVIAKFPLAVGQLRFHLERAGLVRQHHVNQRGSSVADNS